MNFVENFTYLFIYFLKIVSPIENPSRQSSTSRRKSATVSVACWYRNVEYLFIELRIIVEVESFAVILTLCKGSNSAVHTTDQKQEAKKHTNLSERIKFIVCISSPLSLIFKNDQRPEACFFFFVRCAIDAHIYDFIYDNTHQNRIL